MAEATKVSKNRLSACCDIYEQEGKVYLTMEMPGVSKEDLEIKVDDNKLFISGRKELRHPDGEFRIREIREGDYHHVFTIDNTIDRDKIDAEIKNGILNVVLSIKESEKPRRIEIKAS